MASSKVISSLSFEKRAGGQSASADAYWAPNTDVYSTEDGIVIKVELAGIQREDLQLSVEENLLKISGTRPDGCRAPKCTFLVMEINYGAFETVIELPHGYDMACARAAYHNGFLRIDVPRSASLPPKHLSVEILDSQSEEA